MAEPSVPKAGTVPKTAPKTSPKTSPKAAGPTTEITPTEGTSAESTTNEKPIEISTEVTKTGVVDNPAILTTELFGQNRVEVLESEDFRLDSEHQIDLKRKECYIILFHTNNEESKNLAIIWNSVAQQIPGPIFAAVNLMAEKKIAQAFNNLNTNNSTYRSFELKGVPFIISYQNGTPVGFYNGERAVQPISDYALTLACKASYFEPLQLTAGVQSDYNVAMTGWSEYEGTRKSSIDYTTGTSIRQYDATKKPVIVGSEAFTQEGQQVTAEEEQRGITQTETGENIAATSGVTPEETRSSQTEGVETSAGETGGTTEGQPISPK